jgi:Myb-like DNA-binding domain
LCIDAFFAKDIEDKAQSKSKSPQPENRVEIVKDTVVKIEKVAQNSIPENFPAQWSEEEIDILLKSIKKHEKESPLPWATIHKEFKEAGKNRTENALRSRYKILQSEPYRELLTKHGLALDKKVPSIRKELIDLLQDWPTRREAAEKDRTQESPALQKNTSWDSTEKKKLSALAHDAPKPIDWSKIAVKLNKAFNRDRTEVACRKKWYLLKTQTKPAQQYKLSKMFPNWRPAEDRALKRLVQKKNCSITPYSWENLADEVRIRFSAPSELVNLVMTC